MSANINYKIRKMTAYQCEYAAKKTNNQFFVYLVLLMADLVHFLQENGWTRYIGIRHRRIYFRARKAIKEQQLHRI